MKWASSLQNISAYKRCDAHLTTQTSHGAIVTLLGVLLGVTLAIHEVGWFLTGGGIAKTAVDLTRRHDLDIHMDITFPAIPCAGLSVDVMDASGSADNDASAGKVLQIHKIRLDGRGRKLGGRGSEYVTPQSQKMVHDSHGSVMQIDLGAALTQMGDMEKELEGHEGCRVVGNVVVRRVAGKLHFAVHQQSFVDVLPQMLTGHRLPHLTNMSHVIHKMAFGPEFPGQANPLDGFTRIMQPGGSLKAFKYFLKIVPTEYMSRWGVVLETNQYSVSEYSLNVAGTETELAQQAQVPAAVPGVGGRPPRISLSSAVFGAEAATKRATHNDTAPTVSEPFLDFSYDLSPIMMTVAQSPADLLHFLVRLCAVVGGVLSVTRMADKLVHAVLVAAGVVVNPPSIKARHSGAGYSSSRTSLAGMDALSGPGTARSSYAGGSMGGGSAGAGMVGIGSPLAGSAARATAFSSSGGMLPADAAHQRGSAGGGGGAGQYNGGLMPSHPLSGAGSNASSSLLVGMGSGGGYGGYGAGSGSFGGAAMQQPRQQQQAAMAANGSGAGMYAGYGLPSPTGGSLGGAAPAPGSPGRFAGGPAAAGPGAVGGSSGGGGGMLGSTSGLGGSGPLYKAGSAGSSLGGGQQRPHSGPGGAASDGGARRMPPGAAPAAAAAVGGSVGGSGGGASGGGAAFAGSGAAAAASRLATASGPGSGRGV